jgi:tetratricopeptide (TPR) repeat protein/transglutaminase-like putative cysteine protease
MHPWFLAVFVFLSVFAPAQNDSKPAVSAHAESSETKPAVTPPTKSVDYSQEAAVYELYRTVERFENDGTGTKNVTARIRVQSEAGVNDLGQLVFGYNAANQKFDIDYVRVRRADGSVVTATPDAVQDVTAPVLREAPVYTDYREKHVSVPALRPGEILEYSTTTTTSTALAPGQFWFEYDFAKHGIVLDEELEVNIPADRKVKIKTKDEYAPKISQEKDRKIYAWKSSHLDQDEDDDSSADKKKKKKHTAKDEQSDVEMTTFQSWEELGRWYASLEKDRIAPTPEIKAKAAEITKDSQTDLGKVQALYDYVARNFRYVSLSLGRGRYQPHAAGEILANQYGDCKDKHTLLSAMLRAVGLSANAVLIDSSRKLDEDIPSPSQFDHVITYVPLGKQVYWMDTTSEVAPFQLLLSQIRAKRALMIPQSGEPKIVETPSDPAVPNYQIAELNGKISELGKLDGHVRVELRGDSEVMMRSVLRRVPRSKWKDVLRYGAASQGLDGEISDLQISELETTSEPLVVDYDIAVANFFDWSGKHSAIELPMLMRFSLPGADPEADAEDDPIRFGGPIEFTTRFHLTVPDKFTVGAMVPVNLQRDYGEYHSWYKMDGQSAAGQRKIAITVRELPATRSREYLAFRRAVESDGEQKIALDSAIASNSSTPTVPQTAKADDLEDAARSAMEAQRYDVAVALLKRVVELEPKHSDAWLQLGVVYGILRQFDQAEQAFHKQIELNPYDDRTYGALGLTLFQQDKFDDAITAYHKQLEINPLDLRAHSMLGTIYSNRHRWTEAVPEFEQAVSLQSDNAVLRAELGSAYLNTNNSDKALAAFDKAVQLNRSPEILNDVSYELTQKNVHLDRALEYAQSAVDETTTQLRTITLDHPEMEEFALVNSLASYWDTLGWVYFRQGDLDRAERYIRAATALSQHGEVIDHLGQIYEKRGKKDEAIHWYALALASQHPGPDTRGRLATLVGDGKVDQYVKKYKDELASWRTVSLGRVLPEENKPAETSDKNKDKEKQMAAAASGPSADFLLLFSTAGPVEDAKWVRGSEQLKKLAGTLRAAKYNNAFPDGTPTRVVRRGTMQCSVSGDCSLVLLDSDAVNSVD